MTGYNLAIIFSCVLLALALLATIAVVSSQWTCATAVLHTRTTNSRLHYGGGTDIDVVFTWADATPEWLQAKQKLLAPATITTEPASRIPLPCGDSCEIHFAARLVRKNMPWVRHIWILTQRPQNPNIPGTTVVHHDQGVLPKALLPTFNSHAIESGLHRIPGLADRFVYFNDDNFVCRPLTPEHFFTKDGNPLLRSNGTYLQSKLMTLPLTNGYRFAWRNLHTLIQTRLQREQGPYIMLHHPCAITKEVMHDAEELFSKEWRDTAATRQRDIFNIPPVGTALNVGVIRNKVHVLTDNDVYHTVVHRPLKAYEAEEFKKEPPHFLCTNAEDQMENWREVVQPLLMHMLAVDVQQE